MDNLPRLVKAGVYYPLPVTQLGINDAAQRNLDRIAKVCRFMGKELKNSGAEANQQAFISNRRCSEDFGGETKTKSFLSSGSFHLIDQRRELQKRKVDL